MKRSLEEKGTRGVRQLRILVRSVWKIMSIAADYGRVLGRKMYK